jgi:hypothetical protein
MKNKYMFKNLSKLLITSNYNEHILNGGTMDTPRTAMQQPSVQYVIQPQPPVQYIQPPVQYIQPPVQYIQTVPAPPPPAPTDFEKMTISQQTDFQNILNKNKNDTCKSYKKSYLVKIKKENEQIKTNERECKIIITQLNVNISKLNIKIEYITKKISELDTKHKTIISQKQNIQLVETITDDTYKESNDKLFKKKLEYEQAKIVYKDQLNELIQMKKKSISEFNKNKSSLENINIYLNKLKTIIQSKPDIFKPDITDVKQVLINIIATFEKFLVEKNQENKVTNDLLTTIFNNFIKNVTITGGALCLSPQLKIEISNLQEQLKNKNYEYNMLKYNYRSKNYTFLNDQNDLTHLKKRNDLYKERIENISKNSKNIDLYNNKLLDLEKKYSRMSIAIPDIQRSFTKFKDIQLIIINTFNQFLEEIYTKISLSEDDIVILLKIKNTVYSYKFNL